MIRKSFVFGFLPDILLSYVMQFSSLYICIKIFSMYTLRSYCINKAPPPILRAVIIPKCSPLPSNTPHTHTHADNRRIHTNVHIICVIILCCFVYVIYISALHSQQFDPIPPCRATHLHQNINTLKSQLTLIPYSYCVVVKYVALVARQPAC